MWQISASGLIEWMGPVCTLGVGGRQVPVCSCAFTPVWGLAWSPQPEEGEATREQQAQVFGLPSPSQVSNTYKSAPRPRGLRRLQLSVWSTMLCMPVAAGTRTGLDAHSKAGSPWPLVFKHLGYGNPHLHPSPSAYKMDINTTPSGICLQLKSQVWMHCQYVHHR